MQLLQLDSRLELGLALDRPEHPRLGDDIGTVVGLGPLGLPLEADLGRPIDVLIDFSNPEGSLRVLPDAAERGLALVVGTTGFTADQRCEVEGLSVRVPVLIAANFSRAVHVLIRLAEEASRLLGDAADIEIAEIHHRFKVDAPSGTALRLAQAVAGPRGLGPESYTNGREGHTGVRPKDQIGIHALRLGDNPGEHTVTFGLMGERLELSHRALNRDGFVLGALDAARFLAGKPAGLYTMESVLAEPGA